MKPFVYLCALLVVGSVTTGCGDDNLTSPSPASSVRLTAALLPSNEVPPISGSEASGSRHLPQRESGPAPTFEKPAKAVWPGMAELARNPRSRSATLRSAIRTSAPVAPRSSRS